MKIEIGKISSEREAKFGNCLHDIYAAYNVEIDEKLFMEMISETIENHNLHSNLTHPVHILSAVKNLYAFIEKTYGNALRIYKEIPLQYEEDGQIFKGEADLLWETEKGLILIDYKSYPGGRNHLLKTDDAHFAGNYSGQLKKYKEMIEAGHPDGKKVIEALLYYSVTGLLVKIDF